eukprot:8716631-Karenia_brevis.AAC.1
MDSGNVWSHCSMRCVQRDCRTTGAAATQPRAMHHLMVLMRWPRILAKSASTQPSQLARSP